MKTWARLSWIVGPIVLGVLVLAFVWMSGRDANPGPIGLRLDDAWIHLAYARGLVEDQAFAYNPDTPTSGCTSPLWAMMLAVLHWMLAPGNEGGATAAAGSAPASPDALLVGIYILGAALQLATIAAAALAARTATGSRVAGAMSGALVAMSTPWAAGAYSGMEVTLTGFLLVWGVGAVMTRKWTQAGVAMALAGLARPESAAVTLAVAAILGMSGGGARPARRDFVRFLGPSVLAGGALAWLYASTSGSPLPSTFHAKSSFAAAGLLGRVTRAIGEIFPAIPPWGDGFGWLVLVGFLPGIGDAAGAKRKGAGGGPAAARPLAVLPLAAGAVYIAANLALVDPVDPAAFYHVRYILPGVPLLLTALAIGAHRAGGRMAGSLRYAPSAALAAIALVQCVRTAPVESRHLHNDVRNINEVQREIGDWMRENVPDGEWVASADAGAVRYFSRRPTIDVLGLNTPDMRGPGREEYIRSHPVRALALLPAWFAPESAEAIRVVKEMTTANYTATSNPKMATQVVVEADSSRTVPARVRFRGYREFEIELLPAANANAATTP